jgi:hypothetical protein
MTDNIESTNDDLVIKSTCVKIINGYSNVMWVHNIDYKSEEDLRLGLVQHIAEIDKVSPELIKLNLIKDKLNYSAKYCYFLR